MISLVFGIQKTKQVSHGKQKRQRQTKKQTLTLEDKLMVARVEVGRWMRSVSDGS